MQIDKHTHTHTLKQTLLGAHTIKLYRQHSLSLYTLLSINFISVFISLYVYLVCPTKPKPKIYNPNAATNLMSFFYLSFLFSHFLSGVNFLLYLDLFLFLFVNHFANANLSAILSHLSFVFFWYISFAFSGLFLLLSLISAFSE